MRPHTALLAHLTALGADLLDLFAPRACAACAAPHPTFPPRSRPPASPAPAATAPPASALTLTPALCALCAAALDAPDDPPPPAVHAPYAHGATLLRAIHRAKYGDDPSIARALGSLLAHATLDALAPFDAIVPVPLHPHRLATRGFNQAVELARAYARPIAFGAIRRVRDTPSQVTLGRADRLTNVRDAFTPRTPTALLDAHVLIVDDVVTTGATLTEVTRAAHAAGAATVQCVALARAPLHAR